MIRGKSPLRISLAGGGTDLDYIFNKYGGAVVNCTIDKYCHMSLKKRKDDRIFINGKPYTEDVLGKVVVDAFNPDFGFDLIYYNDIPPGSGLGNSSSFVVLLLTLLYEAVGKTIPDQNIINLAHKIENFVKEGGWQDQYATSIGGFNFMEFTKESKTIYPMRLRYRFLQELSEHLVLVYIGGSKENRDLHKELRKYEELNQKAMEKTAKIKNLAYVARDALLEQDVSRFADILKENWKLKRNRFTTNDHVDKIYALALANGAEGGKLCGSGQAGHLLLFVKPENRTKLKEALDLPFVDFNLSIHGTETWKP